MTRAALRRLTPLAALLIASPASAYDYRVLHMIEDRHSHVILRVSEAPESGDVPERGRAACADIPALTRTGRNVARTFGRMFQRSGIHIDLILTSRICRNIEAAKLMQLGPITEDARLDPPSGDEMPQDRAEAILGFIDGLRPSETALFVTHASVIEALTGDALEPGEGMVITLPPFGEIEVRGKFGLAPQ